ncbi:MAG: hypothetical protein J6C37_11775 [Roseburia sp.]|nr:hypothetical protein [Roseburia sp.]
MKITFDDKMMVAAHRGDSYNYYENTMEAFMAAIESGADMIETDVHLTKDGVPVLIHDHTVDRTTDQKGLVSEMTYEELCRLNAGGREEHQTIPVLEELLQLLSEKKILLNLEVKEYYQEGNEERCHDCIDKCVKLIEKYGYADKMVFNSFDAHVLEYIDEKYKGKYMLHGFYPYSIMSNVERNPDEYLYCACIFEDREKQHYDYLQSKGIEPWVGAGVTREGHLKECYELGAKLVTTNFPGNCIYKLEKAGAR